MIKEQIFADPQVTPFVECPNCLRLVDYGTSRCPDCYEEISEDYARRSLAVVAVNTKACAMANTIRTLDITALFALGAALISYFAVGSPPIVIVPIYFPGVALFGVVLWFMRFGRFKLGDEDYKIARRKMQLRLAGWAIFCAALWTFYLFVIIPRHK